VLAAAALSGHAGAPTAETPSNAIAGLIVFGPLPRSGRGPLEFVHFPGVCTLVGSRGRASVAQGCTLGWGMFGPRGADASGYALGGFDLARSMAVELWAAFNVGLPRVVEVNSTIAPSPWASARRGRSRTAQRGTLGDSRSTARRNARFTPRR